MKINPMTGYRLLGQRETVQITDEWSYADIDDWKRMIPMGWRGKMVQAINDGTCDDRKFRRATTELSFPAQA